MVCQVRNEQEPEVHIGLDRVEFLNVDSFEITELPQRPPPNPIYGRPSSPPSGISSRVSAFSTIFPNFGLPKGVQRLHIKKATANRITSGLKNPLLIRSENAMRIKGNEGVKIRGREVIFRADQDLLLRSINGSILLDGDQGVLLDVDSMPIIGSIPKTCIMNLSDLNCLIRFSSIRARDEQQGRVSKFISIGSV